jgi:hypothetical protein
MAQSYRKRAMPDQILLHSQQSKCYGPFELILRDRTL